MTARRVLVFAVVVLLGFSAQAVAGGKKKIAVLDLDSAAVQKSAQKIFGAEVNIGRGISGLVTEYLAVDGTYKLVDRAKIEKTLAKRKFAGLDYSQPENIRKLGKALKADAVLVGRVTHFGNENGRSKKKTRALVVVSARLIAVKSGQVYTADSRGRSHRAGRPLLAGQSSSGATLSLARRDFQSTPLGEAVVTVVDKLGTVVLNATEPLGARPFSVTATVSSVNGAEAILNLGKGMGLKVGRRLPVYREVGEIKDKATGVVIGKKTRRVAVLEVIAADDLSTTARVVSGDNVKVGDGVKIIMD